MWICVNRKHETKTIWCEEKGPQVMEENQIEFKLQLTLEQHGFKLHGSIFMWIIFNKYVGKYFVDLQQLKKIFSSSLFYYKNTIYHAKYVFMLLIQLLTNRLSVFKILWSQKLYSGFWLHRGLAPLIPALIKF